ncbi:MAG: DUF2382 domain-containing protein [Cyanophyceae cyanobacterium]
MRAELARIKDYYPNYKDEVFGGEDIIGYSVYSDNNDKIGEVHDIIVDDTGRLRYFVIDTGFWVFGKKVLLPIGRAKTDFNQNRIYATGMTEEQAKNLPEYNENTALDYDYEERVRGAYRTPATQPTRTSYSRENYSYDYDPSLYDLNEADHSTLRLYEERLVANKNRYKAGEVAVGKRVETETAQVAVPVEKERVVIERTNPTDTTPVAPGSTDFREGEVARVEVYEETAEVNKQAFVREEVSVRKEVDRDTVTAKEQIRREELEVDVDGKPNVKDV